MKLVVSQVIGVPSYHPFLDGIFHDSPTSYWDSLRKITNATRLADSRVQITSQYHSRGGPLEGSLPLHRKVFRTVKYGKTLVSYGKPPVLMGKSYQFIWFFLGMTYWENTGILVDVT